MVRGLTIAILAAVFVASLGTLATDAATIGRPGVTSSEIRVGGVATGGLSGRYSSAFDGVQAYFDVVNAKGGAFGHNLVLARRVDDHGQVSTNVAANRRLIRGQRVFAVLPESTEVFAGARYLATAGIPTFGWNVNLEWSQAPNLFGDRGSYSCTTCSVAAPAYVASQLEVTTVAVIAATEPAQSSCGVGLQNGLDHYGVAVPVVDTAFPSDSANVDADVQKMQAAGVQLVATCGLAVADVARLASAMQRGDLGAVPIYAHGTYDPRAFARTGKVLDGLIAGVGFAPWDAPTPPRGTRLFLQAMHRRGKRPTEAAQAGWVGAGLLVAGIRTAGREFTQASVVAAINAMTDFTADGILPGVDWTSGGHGPSSETCTAFVEAGHGRYLAKFGAAGQPFVCFPDNPLPDSLEGPTLRPGVPGSPKVPSTGS